MRIWGRVQNRVDELLAEVDGIPAFFFLDPFGLGVDFPTMRTVMRERSGPSTEVLVNFSANAVRRIGGLLDSPPDTKGRSRPGRRQEWRVVHPGAEPDPWAAGVLPGLLQPAP